MQRLSYRLLFLAAPAAGLFMVERAVAQAGGPIVPAFDVESRWVVNSAIGPAGSKLVTLTLQSRSVISGPHPADGVFGTLDRRFGDFGILTAGYGPAGAAQPTTIVHSGSGVRLLRGEWGNFPTDVDEQTGEVIYSGMLRGASPGATEPGPGQFSRGMRFFNGWDEEDLNAKQSPPNSSVFSKQNGGFDQDGNLTGFNLLRSDSQSTTLQSRNLVDPVDGGAAWMDIYRVALSSDRPLVFGGSDVTVDFNGWERVALQSFRVGNTWVITYSGPLNSQNQVPTSAHIGFSFATNTAAFAVVGTDSTDLPAACNPADVAGFGGSAGPDGQLTADDIVYFLAQFFAGNVAVADIAGLGGSAGADSQITADDLVQFIGAFFSGCP